MQREAGCLVIKCSKYREVIVKNIRNESGEVL